MARSSNEELLLLQILRLATTTIRFLSSSMERPEFDRAKKDLLMFVGDQQLEAEVARRCEEGGRKRRRGWFGLLMVSTWERWVDSREWLDEAVLLEGMDPERGSISSLGSELLEEERNWLRNEGVGGRRCTVGRR